MNSLRIGITSAITLILLVGNSYASDWYVSAIGGNDTTNDGSSQKSAFRTITKALKTAEGGDAVYIDGAGGKAKYYERIVVPEGKNGLSLVGQNNPELNGKIFDKEAGSNNAIEINSDFVTIKSLNIKDFTGGKDQSLPANGGSAIYCKDRTRTVVENLSVENCTFGIVLWASQSSEITNCRFEKLKKTANQAIGGGIGVLIWSEGAYLQSNEIGVAKPNTFIQCEGYGILIGGKDTSVFVDYTLVKNNQFVSNGVGLGLMASTGIMTIEKNFFDDNAVAIQLLGNALDTYITANTIQSSKPGISILADSKIDGALLADIWLKNDNAFPRTSCALMNKREIADSKGKRYVFNSPESAKSILPDSGKLINFVDAKK